MCPHNYENWTSCPTCVAKVPTHGGIHGTSAVAFTGEASVLRRAEDIEIGDVGPMGGYDVVVAARRKTAVPIYDALDPFFYGARRVERWCGIVFPMPTGISWTNQTGGTACAQPTEEGVFLPLWGGYVDDVFPASSKNPLVDRWDDGPVDVPSVQGYLDRLGAIGRCLTPDSGFSGQWGEAWIPVVVNTLDGLRRADRPCRAALSAFAGRHGFFTTDNSD